MAQPYDQILVLDFETAWSRAEYTLSKLTTEEYIRDPRFKAWGASYKFLGDAGRARWVPASELQAFFDSVDWSRTAVLAHNAMFDVSILSWKYGHSPCFIFDSLSMARATRGLEAGNSLSKLAQEFGFPPKGNAVHSTDGMLDSIPDEVERELAEYCCHDTWLAEQVFMKLLEGFPLGELRMIDCILRMYVNPVIELDRALLKQAIDEEKTKREQLLARLGVTDADLASNDKFAEVLRALGVDDLPTKKSKTTGKDEYAFAKNDAGFQQLQNSDNEEIALLCEARLKVKSTLERTRAQRFLDIANRGTLPCPLAPWGAHTGRIQAVKGQGLNVQNLKRAKDGQRSLLRDSLLAPAGYSFVVADLAQIEPRVLAWLAGFDWLLDLFRQGVDVYAVFGAQMFGVPGMTKETHPDLRQSAKSALIGCGYQLGWWSFATQLLVGFLGAPPVRYDVAFAKQLGIRRDQYLAFMGDDELVEKALTIPRTCSAEDILVHSLCTKHIVDQYRETAAPVKELWGLFKSLIEESLYGGVERQVKCLTFRRGEIVLPSGMSLRYPKLHQVVDEEKGWPQWWFGDPKLKKLYGGKLTENIVQALARIVMTDAMVRLQARYPVVLTVHDEVVLLVPTNEVEEAKPWIRAQMVREPRWMPGIPLAATVDSGQRYGDAK